MSRSHVVLGNVRITLYNIHLLMENSLILINVYDINGDAHFLDLAEYILKKIEPYVQMDLLLLNKMQIKKRRTGFSDEDITILSGIDSEEIHVLFGENVLLENKLQAKKCFECFTKEEKDRYMQFPIYELYKRI